MITTGVWRDWDQKDEGRCLLGPGNILFTYLLTAQEYHFSLSVSYCTIKMFLITKIFLISTLPGTLKVLNKCSPNILQYSKEEK